MSTGSTTRRSSLHSLWRIRSYVRPYTRQMVVMTTAAGVAVGASIVIPLITRKVVDGPIAAGDKAGLLPLGLLALALGVVEAGLVFIRRWVQSYAALGMETTIRDDLYAHLQRLPVAFHDRWQTGQLLSRATTDLSTIRRFLSFGLVYLVVNVATFVVVVGLLVHLYAPLALLVAASAVPLFFISRNLSRAYLDDLATGAGPAGRPRDLRRGVGGGHAGDPVVRPTGPRRPPVPQPGRDAARLGRRQGHPGGALLVAVRPDPEPHPRRGAAVRLARGDRGRDDPRRPGRVRVPDADAGLAGRLARLDPRQRPGGDDRGRPHLRGVRHRAHDRRPGRRRRRHPDPRRAAVRGRRLQLRRQLGAGAARRRPRRPAGRDTGGGRGHRQRQEHPDRPRAAAVRRHGRAHHPRRARRPRPPAGIAAPARRRWRSRTPPCSPPACATT